MELKDLITLVPSSAALIVSLVVAARTRHYNRTTLRAASRNNYMNALLNINREIVGHPELWAVYDPRWRPAGHELQTEAVRRRAFIWYHINLFELFYTDYHQYRLGPPDSADRQHWDAWDNYIRSFLEASPEAQAIVRDKASMALLNRDFRNYLSDRLPETTKT